MISTIENPRAAIGRLQHRTALESNVDDAPAVYSGIRQPSARNFGFQVFLNLGSTSEGRYLAHILVFEISCRFGRNDALYAAREGSINEETLSWDGLKR